ncbi:MAG: group III truncated hemoglobin [Aureispira sp.]|nr:group III truncated hemoglobin [Aureispira sp.]
MKADIQTPEDIEALMRAFYSRVLADEEIGYIFTDVAKLNLETHMPRICAFWENVLLGSTAYKKNVLQVHLDLHQEEALKPEHFERWLMIFDETVDAQFEGEIANMAKVRGRSIATVMQTKIYKQSLF